MSKIYNLKIFLELLFSLEITKGAFDFKKEFSTFSIQGKVQEQKKAAESVIARILGPKNANLFALNIIENQNQNDHDGFSILKTINDDKVLISGVNALSVLWGFNYYLKKYCNCHVSWDGDQVNIPSQLPLVNETKISIDRVRFYQNPCTSSYSFVWWTWNRWEREIDWMALNGINLVLAFTAQEVIWQRVYDALGLEYNDFTGPAFLAWNRMGNLRNYSCGLTANWHQQQIFLQHKILKRMRSLGITPVFPAFSGIVPRSFAKAYPKAKLIKISPWNRFSEQYCCPYLLDPTEELFSVVGRIFLREYINEFGTNHIYSCDVFNENIPPSDDINYLRNISKSIYDTMNFVDPSAIWLLQGWMFIHPFWADEDRARAFVTGVPKGKLLILDLQSDLTPQFTRLHSYFGQPFIWCTLHNFGGRLGMYGHLERVNRGIPFGRQFKNSTMVGLGITPEGIDQNYVMYEFTLESAFRRDPVNLSEWICNYALRRYGSLESNVIQAWLLLLNSVYNYEPKATFQMGVSGSKQIKLPLGVHISKNILTKLPSPHMNEIYWYNRSIIVDIFEKFLKASQNNNFSSSELYRHDLIDVTRQMIQIAISILYFNAIRSYALLNIENFQNTSDTFIDLLDELDIILGSGKKFLLGTWIEGAKNLGANFKEKLLYEFDARNQITLWGPNGEIRDYAAKQWAGLIVDYYKPRWVIFFDALNKSLIENKPCNYSAVKESIFTTVEKPFGFDRKVYSTSPRGNPVEIVQNFYKNWKTRLHQLFKNIDFNVKYNKKRLQIKFFKKFS